MTLHSTDDIDYVFTAACLVAGTDLRYLSRGAQCCLLFGKRRSHLDLGNLEYHKEIANADLTRHFLGDSFAIIPIHYEHQKPRWGDTKEPLIGLIATNEPDATCRGAIGQAKTLPVTVVQKGHVTHREGLEVFNACELPEKYVVGCGGCRTGTETHNTCPVVKLENLEEIPEFEIDTYSEDVTYWKSRIGRFVAVGPSYTSADYITPAHRTIVQHSFKYVSSTISDRRNTAQEMGRRAQFRREICSQCLMKEPCWYEGAPKHCTKYYPQTLREISLEIVKNTPCKFTGPQLRVLLANSGPMDKRFNRYKGHFTLKYPSKYLGDSEGVKFVINQKTDPGHTLAGTDNYKTALSWLHDYGDAPWVPEKARHMGAHEKAVLFELLQRNQSPTRNNGWRQTTYPVNFVAKRGSGPYYVEYSWGPSGRYVLPWPLRAENLFDVYKNYKNLRCVSGIRPPDLLIRRHY